MALNSPLSGPLGGIRSPFGSALVSGGAPTITASDSLSGRDLTISVDSLTGAPAPSVALTALTLGGVDVLGDESGSDPWVYSVPDNAESALVSWTLTATNNAGSDTASGATSIPANLAAVAGGTTTDISDGGKKYRVHKLTLDETIVVGKETVIDHLLVAGGGASGAVAGGGAGGGGGGGVLKYVAGETGNGSQITLSPGMYPVGIGLGGQAGVAPLDAGGVPGTNGGDTTAFGLTAIGGGYGGTANTGVAADGDPPSNGGSGGGGAGSPDGVWQNSSPGAAGTTGQGFAGGDGLDNSDHRNGGGGGGAATAGLDGAIAGGGDGGDGVESSIAGTSSYYGGGGGAGVIFASHGTPGSGGLGGGGDGAAEATPTAGTDETGGGAGGAGQNQNGADGGSGVVLIRYEIFITALTQPVLGPLKYGQTVASALSADALNPANYDSPATITGVTVEVTIDGESAGLTDVTISNQSVNVRIFVTDSAGNVQDFDAGTQLVEAGPELSNFSITETEDVGTLNVETEAAGTMHVWIGDTAVEPDGPEIRDGTGADASASTAITLFGGPYPLALPPTLDGDYRVSVVGEDTDGTLLNVLTQSPVTFNTGSLGLFAESVFFAGNQTYTTEKSFDMPFLGPGDYLIFYINHQGKSATGISLAGKTAAFYDGFGSATVRIEVWTVNIDGGADHTLELEAALSTFHGVEVVRIGDGSIAELVKTTSTSVSLTDTQAGIGLHVLYYTIGEGAHISSNTTFLTAPTVVNTSNAYVSGKLDIAAAETPTMTHALNGTSRSQVHVAVKLV